MEGKQCELLIIYSIKTCLYALDIRVHMLLLLRILLLDIYRINNGLFRNYVFSYRLLNTNLELHFL